MKRRGTKLPNRPVRVCAIHICALCFVCVQVGFPSYRSVRAAQRGCRLRARRTMSIWDQRNNKGRLHTRHLAERAHHSRLASIARSEHLRSTNAFSHPSYLLTSNRIHSTPPRPTADTSPFPTSLLNLPPPLSSLEIDWFSRPIRLSDSYPVPPLLPPPGPLRLLLTLVTISSLDNGLAHNHHPSTIHSIPSRPFRIDGSQLRTLATSSRPVCSCRASNTALQQQRAFIMSDCHQGMSCKRTLADPGSSSPITPKRPRIAPACSPSKCPPCSTSSTDAPRPALPFDQAASHEASEARRGDLSSSSRASASCASTASSCSAPSTTSAPLPRYALGIPHLDLLLPARDGLDLLHSYHQGTGWIYSPFDRNSLFNTLEEAERHGADSIHPHRLACLLAALALGDLFSPCFPSASNPAQTIDTPSKRGRIWFGVASACLAGSHTDTDLMRHPTPDACSALYLMSTYLLCSNDEELFHRSQGLTGLALILAKTALVPACVPSAQTAVPPSSGHHQATAEPLPTASSPASPSRTATSVGRTNTAEERLQCNRLLSDLIFHLRCQILTFAHPSSAGQSASAQPNPSLNSFPDVPTIQAIWTAFGTPLYATLDAFGNRYSPNIFHNWKLGLADLMHQVSCLTNQTMSLEHLTSASKTPSDQPAEAAGDASPGRRSPRAVVALPDHGHIVKLDERIRRYHASLPDFLLLHRPLPFEMAGKVDEDELAQIICQRHMACSMVHRMLMALHRPWFLSALACRSKTSRTKSAQQKHNDTSAELQTSSDASPPSSETAPESAGSDSSATGLEMEEQPSPSAMFSLSAVLRSATWQTETFASAAACAPPQALAWWQFTNNALAAAIVQATALLRLSCPSTQASSTSRPEQVPSTEQPTPVAHFHSQVRNDLDKNICSFQNVAKRCKLAAKALPFLQRVSTAIDLGFCKSKSTASCSKDALQSDIAPQNACNGDPTSFTNTPTPTRNQSGLESFICNNSTDSISHSNIRNNSNSNSNSNSIHRIPVPSHSNAANSNSNIEPHPPSSSTPPSTTQQKLSGRPLQVRRASSAKSELETIFGPLASGLEPSAPSPSPNTVKPLYRQNLDPIPVAPVAARDGYENSSQPSYSEDGGSSSSSAMLPSTPGARSPQVEASRLPEVKDAAESENGNTAEAASNKEKRPNQASDLVLQCIRFWQPDMLAIPPTS